MTVKELIEKLSEIEDSDKKILVACDEEWNTLFEKIEIQSSHRDDYVIFGLSGSEVEEDEVKECERCGGELSTKLIGDESHDYCKECNWISR